MDSPKKAVLNTSRYLGLSSTLLNNHFGLTISSIYDVTEWQAKAGDYTNNEFLPGNTANRKKSKQSNVDNL